MQDRLPTTRVELRVLLLLLASGALLFAATLIAPPNLLGNNERRMAAYVMDILQNGHWWCQHDGLGRLMTKPPMFAWLTAFVSLPFSELNRFALYFPSAAATIGTALTLFYWGRRWQGWKVGAVAGFMYLLSPVGLTQVAMARYDGLLAFWVLLGAVAALRAWETGQGWTWFWLAGAGGTLTKGPLAILLASLGLLAWFWERCSGARQPVRGSQWLGVALFTALVGGWLAMAYRQEGPALLDVMLGKELAGHVVKSTEGVVGQYFHETPLAFLGYFAPWSVLALLGLWRVWRRPSADAVVRRQERFLWCWFVVGIILFGLAPHQRARLIYPLIAPAALLGSRELVDWLRPRLAPAAFQRWGLVAVLVGTVGLAFAHHVIERNRPRSQLTVALRDWASDITATVGREFPITHAEWMFVLRYYLNSRRTGVSDAEAVELLRGNVPAFVATEEPDELLAQLGDTSVHQLRRWGSGRKSYALFSNHPRLEWTDPLAVSDGPLRLTMHGARPTGSRRNDHWFAAVADNAAVEVRNISDHPVATTLTLTGTWGVARLQQELLSGQEARVSLPPPATPSPALPATE